MKQIIYFFGVALTSVLAISCGSSKTAADNSQAANKNSSGNNYVTHQLSPTIDGQVGEWADSLFTFDNNAKIRYAVANDAKNIYVAIISLDRLQQMKMTNGGTEIWIDSKVKKNKSIGVKYPIGGEEMKMPERGSGQQQPNPEQMKAEMRAKMLRMELAGFKPDFNGSQSIFSNSQVIPVIDWNKNGDMVYEIAIPFSALVNEEASNIKDISVGIIIKGMQMPSMSGGGVPGGGMPGGGGMRPPGGGPPGGSGGSRPDMSQMENMSKENAIWTKYTVVK
jgi:hypothetical protein